MQPVWLKHYQEGVPSTINPDAYPSLNAFFAECFAKYRPLPAFTNMGQVLTYDQLDKQSLAFAAFLQNTLKLPKGDRVAIMLPNVMQYPVAMLGILRAGCIVVNVNPLYTADEFKVQICDAQASTIIVLDKFADVAAKVIEQTSVQHIIVAKLSDVFPFPKSIIAEFYIKYLMRMVPPWHFKKFYYYKDVLEQGFKQQYHDPDITGKDVAFLQYTGGTTGLPKGAMLTHRNMVANIMQASAWMGKTLVPRQETIITALPLYHIFSLTANCLTFLYFGAFNVLITNPRDTKSFLKDLNKHKFTAITGVNTLFNLLLNTPGFEKVDFSGLKVALGGGMAVQSIVATKWQNMTGHPLLGAYGLSETSPAVCINPMNITAFNGTVGLPISSTDISVRDVQDNELGFDTPGELWVRGPQVMLGYWRQEAETSNVLSEDGWLRTGDVVTVSSEGFVTIVDRIKDLIAISGFKVYPNEVEEVISAMPGIKEVAVVGVPDPVVGEQVKAFIVKKDASLSEDDVKAYCHQHLTGYKVPRFIEFCDSLPKSNVGKVLRRALR